MIKIVPILFFLLLIPSDTDPQARYIDKDFETFEGQFMSAVRTYVIIDLATAVISDDLLSAKIIDKMLGKTPREIYIFIYTETGGDVPDILKPYYPWSDNGSDSGIIKGGA